MSAVRVINVFTLYWPFICTKPIQLFECIFRWYNASPVCVLIEKIPTKYSTFVSACNRMITDKINIDYRLSDDVRVQRNNQREHQVLILTKAAKYETICKIRNNDYNRPKRFTWKPVCKVSFSKNCSVLKINSNQ